MKTIDMRFLGTTSLLVFGMGALSSQALAAPSIETNFNVTADMGDIQSIVINSATNGWRNAGTASGSTPSTYRYVAINFTTNATGSFTFGQNAYPIDTTMAVYYNDAFDLNDLVDADAYNDDGSDSSKQCGGYRCPQVTAELVEGQRNTLVISTYNPATGDSLILPISAYAIGPGNVLFTLYTAEELNTAEELSVFDSASSLKNFTAYDAARIIDSNPALRTLFSELEGDTQVSTAASQTLPLLGASSYQVTQGTLAAMNRTVGTRQAELRGLSSGDGILSDRQLWVKPFGSWVRQDDRNGVSGYDANTAGLMLGIDADANQYLRVGGAFAYASSDVDSNSHQVPQSLDVESYQLIGYGTYTLAADTDVTFQVDTGLNKNESSRTLAFTGNTAEADYDSHTAHLGLGLHQNYRISDANLVVASALADYTWIHDDDYRESGAGDLNLDVGSRTTEALVVGLRGELIHELTANVRLNASLGGGYDLIDEDAAITSAYAGASSSTFTTEGLDLDPWTAQAGAGLTYLAVNGVDISAQYQTEHRSDFRNQTASLRLRWPL
ncbi:outer membrane autotransporter barrel domain-containing protein [Onishia taeanensis]|uniref:Outer membrane autotransporter barrel domain-containing protein n=1 Tax=Onishia taeanensis TaxID=284577 RepID=A0A1G7NGE2_9GAMM|nr:autotransporter outer membrane beta-barrel domain-containing protein [Halomonas taeanensis]SDF73036.1 outer membrane autotransporter barrel domain-containing protein [Halomonas taeanensis]